MATGWPVCSILPEYTWPKVPWPIRASILMLFGDRVNGVVDRVDYVGRRGLDCLVGLGLDWVGGLDLGYGGRMIVFRGFWNPY